MSALKRHAWWIVPALVAIATYSVTIGFSFVWDDNVYLARWIEGYSTFRQVFFPHALPVGFFLPFYKPVPVALELALYKVFGAKPAEWHAAVVCLHALAATGVAALARRLVSGERKNLAGLVAGVTFAVWPGTAHGIAWIAAMADPIMTAACSWALVMHLRARDRGTTSLPAAFGFLVAMLSKEVTVAFVPVAIAATFFVPPEPGARRAGRSAAMASALWLPYVLAAVLYVALRDNALGRAGDLAAVAHQRVGLDSILPAVRAFGYDWLQILTFRDASAMLEYIPALGAVVVPAIVGAVLCTAGLIAGRKVALRPVMLATFWFCCFLAPPLAMAADPFAVTPVAGRYLYAPSVAFALVAGLAAVWVVTTLPSARLRAAAAVAFALAAALLAVRSAHLTEDWRDDDHLWNAAWHDDPTSCVVWFNLAGNALRHNDKPAAEDALRVSAYACVFPNPEQRHIALVTLADVYLLDDKLDLARIALKEAAKLPGTEQYVSQLVNDETLLMLFDSPKGKDGSYLVPRAKLERQAQALEHAAEIDPFNRSLHLTLARLDESLGEPVRAEQQYRVAANVSFSAPEIHAYCLAQAQRLSKAIEDESDPLKKAYFAGERAEAAGKTEEAIDAYRRALAIDPDREEIWIPLASLEAQTGDSKDAIARLEKAVEKNPKNGTAWFNLGVCQAMNGQFPEAVDAFESARTLEPDWVKPWVNEAAALERAGDPARASLLYQEFLNTGHGDFAARSFAARRLAVLTRAHGQ